MLDILKSHYKRFGKFSVVGVLNTLIDFSAFSILLYGLGVHYVVAHVSAFVIANANSFIFNSLWTFQVLRGEVRIRHALVFFFICLCGLGLSTLALYVSVGIFAVYFPGAGSPHLWSKVIACVVSLVWNYIGSWLFVFKDGSKDKPSLPI